MSSRRASHSWCPVIAAPHFGETAMQISRVTVCNGRALAQQEGNVGPQRDFDSFDRIQCQDAEFFVEHVEIEDLAELRSGPEIVADGNRLARLARARCPERIPVSAQALVADPCKRRGRPHVVGDQQALGPEQGDLFGDRKIRFRVRLHGAMGKTKRRPTRTLACRGASHVEFRIRSKT